MYIKVFIREILVRFLQMNYKTKRVKLPTNQTERKANPRNSIIVFSLQLMVVGPPGAPGQDAL